MSAKERVTITLTADILASARKASGGDLSAYIERTLRIQTLTEAARAINAWRPNSTTDTEELLDTFAEGHR
ncbi:hypothetical protein [Streptomyces gobiensis]|uniref:hypothetical protein n=1 Tax=Streptomyces gobiensis TaxID=2875706 RepID=UPI001E5963AE|nr:hypothetical protein [Streptomyces gobiensis]UGY92835.1 hypothetical protein test1122_14740 [Streptomyces gobiensis]